MRKNNVFKKIFVGAIMVLMLAVNAIAMASPQKEVYDFNEGSKIVHIEGDHSEVLLETRKELWAGLEEGRSVSYLMSKDLDKNTTNVSIVLAPKGESEVYIDKTIIINGDLEKVIAFEAMKLANGWKLEFHEEWGTIWEPYAEGILSKKIQ